MSLKERFIQEIKLNGPMPLNYFMQSCLSDSRYGYYQKQEPFGESGDFITAPEISQIFGELISLYAIYQYEQLSEIDSLQIIELGAGNASLLDDFLRTAKKFPDFYSKISLAIVETSARLRQKQISQLQKFQIPISHYYNFSEIPHKPSFIIANEFFDALPILQFEYHNNQWYERKIDYQNGEFIFCLVQTTQAFNYAQKFLYNISAPEKGIFEISPTSISIFSDICDYIQKTKSNALIIDYGYLELNFKPSLQALRQHKYHDLFTNLGKADLTSHVNFPIFKQIAEEKNCTTGITTQKSFLEALGISQRAEMLQKNKNISEQKKIIQSVERLISPKQMGEIFKIMTISH